MIGIFKTNIGSQQEREHVIREIASHFPVGPCHVDLDDCDKVLRIADLEVAEETIIDFVKTRGFYCEVLE
ncbi:hypothetical protein [Chitinophaga vietnamensis]|uniref:hypothetical protein n=1 Tax=Chitinophaga vietnamensis TaxID=2593957 RepID=UPI001178B41B|nr:hypothetical protein [Chitinophaga vietnamensis]